MASPHETIVKTLTEARQQELLESGLSRINHHLNDGKDLAILSSVQDKDTPHSQHVKMINDIRHLGYGPIEATGHTANWNGERSVVVPSMTAGHAKQIGSKYGQQAVIHYKGKTKTASTHWLKDVDDHENNFHRKAGQEEEIGQAHFNKPNSMGITVLKGAGYNPKDKSKPTRSFTFSKEDINKDCDVILEWLMKPPRGMFSPYRSHYVLEKEDDRTNREIQVENNTPSEET